MLNNICVLGCTGSIGTQTLDVARNLGIRVCGLAANSNVDLVFKQAIEFRPYFVAIRDDKSALKLKKKLRPYNIEVYQGDQGIIQAATSDRIDTVIVSVVGTAGILPTLEAIKAGKNIALANKETLVSAGSIIMAEAKKRNIQIRPIDSEHSAIFQCLMGQNENKVSKVILTASGGAFRNSTMEEFRLATIEDALKHPTWNMGKKVTVDCATLMNKGLEVIEAKWLFDLEPKQLEVLIHPESIVHSIVEYIDGSSIVQMAFPDMRIPIQFALTYPDREFNEFPRLDLSKIHSLNFYEPNYQKYKCLQLAMRSLEIGGTMPAVLNAANEAAVKLFLDKKVNILDIAEIVENQMCNHNIINNASVEDILNLDVEIKNIVLKNS